MMADQSYVIGIDFGTLSGRASVIRTADGAEVGAHVVDYPHGVLEADLDGVRLPPDTALQVPADYLRVLAEAVPRALADAGAGPGSVVGLGLDVTSATVIPTTPDGTPLCELGDLAGRPHAYAKLWKHHGAHAQTRRLVDAARQRGEPWLARYGGTLSVELAVPKLLELAEADPQVYARTAHFVEALDWIVWQLTGEQVCSAAAAGYKSLHQDGTHPSAAYLEDAGFPSGPEALAKLTAPTMAPLGAQAGALSARGAEITGLPAGIAVAVGNIDAHVTAPAAAAVEPGQLTMILGTSTCFIVSAEEFHEVPGMFGAVDGGIVAGLWGYEAGQSGVGDIFAWFVDTCVPPEYHERARAEGVGLHDLLSGLAADQPVGAHGLIALDWHNGNRSILVDPRLSGLVLGQTLATRPEDTYRALVEATAFGARTIVESFERAGVAVTEIVAAGGLIRNGFLMQVYADVLGRPLAVVGSRQAGALGSGIHAAVAAGVFPDVRAAAAVMGRRADEVFTPDPAAVGAYQELFALYTRLHDAFGRDRTIMHELKELRDAALKG
ncbi:ribulokinase [Occultella kanbiaonis]|uniref:ribulokinase n=1 Tax=Occultella kanbiaonis TaxID=2675754 RepID=UPI001A98E086|nr:ribulokinase [Occultella kanbiaonis]